MCMCYVRLLLTKNPTLNPTGRDKKIERENPHGYTQVCTQLLLIFDLAFLRFLWPPVLPVPFRGLYGKLLRTLPVSYSFAASVLLLGLTSPVS